MRLYGDLGRRFGRNHAFAIGSPAEALRALRANFPEFEQAIRADGRYMVLAGKRQLGEGELDAPSGRAAVRIVPIVSGGGATGRVILGAALVAFAWWNPAGWAGATLIGSTTVGAVAGAIGWSLVIGGVGQMLAAPAKHDAAATESPEHKPSYAFDGPVNTTAQGLPVPICYGELIVGSAVISSGMYAEDVAL